MSDFGIMQYAASGMDAQRSALDVLARNVALTQTADSAHPVHPLVPQFAFAGTGDGDDGVHFAALTGEPAVDSGDDDEAQPLDGQILFAGARPSPQSVTGIDAVSEMVSVLGAQRSYEADANVFDDGKRLVERTLEVEGGS